MCLVTGGRTLQILNAKEEDAGRYTCMATNEAGETLKNYEVKVFSMYESWSTSPPFGVEEYNTFCVSVICNLFIYVPFLQSLQLSIKMTSQEWVCFLKRWK